ncbi:biotin-dependent carboxyltransferase family protein [Marinobacter halophilus]|uniref:Allophanate hydrolase n=1 Tax=Marinobacter halophilus TaxID=1323740 RepID=A0A2T1K8K7_9GAMM|nr:biotin-dependent carboxyltransferase family protein [Marinobacter halophilus]PSF06358.1 allophanate hydrolase [Marinobacter halophilus]GGC71889.1 allophanate hydrolase [Marinobacter halophilus]
MSWLDVISPGVQSTVQDAGRQGYRHHGLAGGGALDIRSYTWANKLLDNPRNAACLEIILGGFHGVARGQLQIALTGAEAPVAINGNPVQLWQTLNLNDGDELTIGHSTTHRLIYLAVAGGLDTPLCFDSRSVVVREHVAGLAPVKPDDKLTALQPGHELPSRFVPISCRPGMQPDVTLRLVPGYQYSLFKRTDILRLTTSVYTVSEQSDRMGFRLQGPALASPPAGIISEGIAQGAMQIPGDGLPIVLLNDCQTIGGYPKPGVVPSLDCGALAQQLPGANIRFELTDLATVQNERRLFEHHYHQTRWCQNGRSLAWL